MRARDPLASTSDPVLAALARAPRVERLTAEQRVELDEDVAAITAGRVRVVPHAEVPAALAELADGE